MFNKAALKASMVLMEISVKELCKELGITESTFYRKMERDGDFSRKEINKMIKILKIGDPERIFFAEKLA